MLLKALAFAAVLMSTPSFSKPAERVTVESPFTFAGRVYTDHYFPVYPSITYPSGIFQSSISAWLDVTAKSSKNTSFHFVGQADAFLRSLTETEQSSGAVKLREGFFSYLNDSLELRVGQQIIPWGKSDGVNPTDYFTAKDYTSLNPDDEVRRIGAPSVMVNFTPEKGTSPLNFIGIFQAVYPQTRLIIPARAIPQGIQFQKYPQAPTPFQQETMEFGGKISFLQNDFDLSISAFRGVNHFAQYVYDFANNRITPKNIQQTAIGGDGSITAGDYVFRAETAYYIPDEGKENSTLYALVQPSHWDSSVGVERSFFEDFHVQIQGLYRYHIGYVNPSLYQAASPTLTQIQQNVARANGLLLNFQRAVNLGATFRVGFSNDTSPFTADIFLVGYFADGQDFLLRPQVTYKAMEGLRFTAGMDLYGGDESRPLGALTNNSSLFFEGRYLF